MNRKLLIVGYGRHGKDTVAEMLRDHMGYKFISSSEFVGRRCVWPQMQTDAMDTFGEYPFNYASFEECFADRANHRPYWADAISAYNTPDKTRTASEMLEGGYDIYVGMRRRDELLPVKEKKLFDEIVWVDRSDHLPPEPKTSMDITPEDADTILDNNGSMADLVLNVQRLMGAEGATWI